MNLVGEAGVSDQERERVRANKLVQGKVKNVTRMSRDASTLQHLNIVVLHMCYRCVLM